jgi:hypothetical protein
MDYPRKAERGSEPRRKTFGKLKYNRPSHPDGVSLLSNIDNSISNNPDET